MLKGRGYKKNKARPLDRAEYPYTDRQSWWPGAETKLSLK